MPALSGSVVFAEDDAQVKPWDFDRDLVSLLQQPAFAGVTGLVIGRFQKATGMTRDLLAEIVHPSQSCPACRWSATLTLGMPPRSSRFPSAARSRSGPSALLHG